MPTDQMSRLQAVTNWQLVAFKSSHHCLWQWEIEKLRMRLTGRANHRIICTKIITQFCCLLLSRFKRGGWGEPTTKPTFLFRQCK